MDGELIIKSINHERGKIALPISAEMKWENVQHSIDMGEEPRKDPSGTLGEPHRSNDPGLTFYLGRVQRTIQSYPGGDRSCIELLSWLCSSPPLNRRKNGPGNGSEHKRTVGRNCERV